MEDEWSDPDLWMLHQDLRSIARALYLLFGTIFVACSAILCAYYNGWGQ